MNSSWQNTPAYSTADIQALWDERPDANVGIATGLASGVWVLDIDPEHGGLESMAALVAEHGPMPPTLVTQTGSGGYHYFFACPEDFEVTNDQNGHVASGIDVRGRGGQVVAPPSRSAKGGYRVISDAEVAKAPQWLLEAVRKPDNETRIDITPESLPKPEDIPTETWDRYNNYTSSAVTKSIERLKALAINGWNGEPWNATTFEVSCNLIEFANSPWCAYDLGQAQVDVWTHAPRDNDGFDSYIVKRTFQSALDKVGQSARPLPPDRDGGANLSPNARSVSRSGNKESPQAADDGHDDSGRFFDKSQLKVHTLGQAVLDAGPVGRGDDGDFWAYKHGVWLRDPDIVKHRCVDFLGERYRKSHAENASDVVARRAWKIRAEPHRQYMNFHNGMLDWQTGELLNHSPDFKSTIQFPLIYDANADCPTFDQFLADVMHSDYVDLAWEMLGYLMFSGNPMQVAFMLYGRGQNGKGTLLRVIEQILGAENIANESLDQLNTSAFSSVNLYGKIANIAGDIDATYQESTANFKKLTGEDTIGAERKYGARFNFENWAVPLFSANRFPGSSDVSHGYLRRWVVLHFHKTISEERKVVGLDKLLATEIPGIVAKAVRALRRLMLNNSFVPKGEATKAIEEFAQTIDNVRKWSALEVLRTPGERTLTSDLYQAYRIWASSNGYSHPVAESEFSRRLETVGYPVDGSYHLNVRASASAVAVF